MAGVDPSRVTIISITSSDAIRSISHGAQRRRGATEVRVRVAGILRLKGLERTLKKHGFPRSTVKTKVQKDHHVTVRRRAPLRWAW